MHCLILSPLGLDGRLAPGYWADKVSVDLTHPTLAGWNRETLLESIVFGADNDVISGTWVGGRA